MSLTTPDTIRTLQRKLYAKAKQLGACRGVKNIGKPCAGKPHARFDEGGLARLTTIVLNRCLHRKDQKWRQLGPSSLLYPEYRHSLLTV